MTERMRRYLFAGVSAMVLGSLPAWAVAAPARAYEPSAEAVMLAATGPLTSLQDAPIAVSELNAETVKNAGITDVRGVQQLVPSVRFETGASSVLATTASIRGIGTNADNPGLNGSVGIYIDGVHRRRVGLGLSELPQVSHINVLRGPQGTLFGENSTAGAISVTTMAPSFERRGFVSVAGGNYAYKSASFGLTGAVIDERLAASLDGNVQVRNGSITDARSNRDVNDRNRWNLRGQVLWTFDAGSLRVIADTARTDEQCCSAVSSQLGSFMPAVNSVAALFGSGIGLMPPDPAAHLTTLTPARDMTEDVQDSGISITLDRDIGAVHLTSISAYRDWQALRNQDMDLSDIDRLYRAGAQDSARTLSQEVRLSGQADKLKWMVGGYYADETLNHTDKVRFGTDGAHYIDSEMFQFSGQYNVFGSLGPLANSACGPHAYYYPGCKVFAAALMPPASLVGLNSSDPAVVASTRAQLDYANAYAMAVAIGIPVDGSGQNADAFETHTENLALFTHNEYAITDKLTVSGGLRWSQETKSVAANLDATTPACGALISTPDYAATTQTLLQGPLAPFLRYICNSSVNPVANGTYSDSLKSTAWTGTLGLTYRMNDDYLFYGNYAHGYKSGGYNLDRSGFDLLPTATAKPLIADLRFDPEVSDAVEVGVKSSLFNGMTGLNLNLFYEKITDFQLQGSTGYASLVRNAPRLISRGVELDTVTKPMTGLTIQAGLLYDQAYFDRAVHFGEQSIQAGDALAGQPKWTMTSAVTYRRPIPGTELEGLVFVDGRFNTSYATQNLMRDPQGSTDNAAYAIFNARFAVGDQRGRWSTEVFIRNLSDKYYTVGGFQLPEQPGNFAVYPGEPRTYGAKLRVNF
jgi:outer membrane receptor protein involved in Fe transport